jgi:DNA-binding CsgD family transcriptional regulator
MIHIVFAISITTFLLDVSSGIIAYAVYKWQKLDTYRYFCACALSVACMVVMYLVSAYGSVSGIAQTRSESSIFFYIGNAIVPAFWFALYRSIHLFMSVPWTRRKSIVYVALVLAPPLFLFLSFFANGAARQALERLNALCFDAQSFIFLYIVIRYRRQQAQKDARIFLDVLVAIIVVFAPLFILEDFIGAIDAFYSSLGLTWPSFILYEFFISLAGIRFAIASLVKPRPSATPTAAASQLGERGLSKREIDVAVLLLERLSYKEIAESLFISMPTVKSHVHHIFGKLRISTRAELTALAGRPDRTALTEPARPELPESSANENERLAPAPRAR